MSDVLKGLTGGWNFLVSWIFPSAIAWAVFALLDFPSLRHVPIFGQIAATSAGNQALVLLGASVLTGLVMNGLSTVLFRLIEGYYLVPEPIALWMRQRQQRRWQALKAELEELQQLREEKQSASDQTSESPAANVAAVKHIGIDVRIGLIRERLRRYPADARQFGPTRFANALRAMETYGWDRYRLDSQTLWSELISVVPDSLRSEEESARTPVNFSVSMTYLSGLVGVVCLILGFTTSASVASIAVGAVSMLLVPAWYRLAVLNTRYLNSVIQAIVNVGRVDLAKKMGLSIPRKLDDERDMWERTFWFVDEHFDQKYSSDLNTYRLERKEDEDS